MGVFAAIEPFFLDDEFGHAMSEERYAAVVGIPDDPENVHARNVCSCERGCDWYQLSVNVQSMPLWARHGFGRAEAPAP